MHDSNTHTHTETGVRTRTGDKAEPRAAAAKGAAFENTDPTWRGHCVDMEATGQPRPHNCHLSSGAWLRSSSAGRLLGRFFKSGKTTHVGHSVATRRKSTVQSRGTSAEAVVC